MVLDYIIGRISHGRIGELGATAEFNATFFLCQTSENFKP